MPQTDVSSCVLSIITSFSSGLDVFKRFKDVRPGQVRKVKKTGKSLTEEEMNLARSLRQGPEDIAREYQRSVQILGHGFAIGDTTAQTSLAEVLLKLNTGLVDIINTFLSRKTKNVKVDYQSLTVLSDQSRIETCQTLRQLYRRMIPLRPPPVTSSLQSVSEASKSKSSVRDVTKRKRGALTAKHNKPRTPILARVVVENSTKPSQIALVKAGERKKRAGRPNTASQSHSASSPILVASVPQSSESASIATRSLDTSNNLIDAEPRRPKTKRNLTSLDVTASTLPPRIDVTQVTRSSPDLKSVITPEIRTLPSTPLDPPMPRFEPRRRKPTPTYYSIASGSTRLGEVPLHKWAEPYDFDAMSVLNREAARNGWPVGNPAPLNSSKKKRFGFFGLFRKNESKT